MPNSDNSRDGQRRGSPRVGCGFFVFFLSLLLIVLVCLFWGLFGFFFFNFFKFFTRVANASLPQ